VSPRRNQSGPTEAEMDEALAQTFPASDPPAWSVHSNETPASERPSHRSVDNVARPVSPDGDRS